MTYAKTSLRSEQRALREQMEALRLSRRQIVLEFARRYRMRPRAAWRNAHGWTLREAAERISGFASASGLSPGGVTVAMTAPHLSEYESWPGPGTAPAGRRPTPYLLSLLASVYGCAVRDLLDIADYEHLPMSDRLVIDSTSGRDAEPAPAAMVTGAPSPGDDSWQDAAKRHGLSGVRRAAVSPPAPSAASLRGQDELGQPHHSPFRHAVLADLPGSSLSPARPGHGTDWNLRLPEGRALAGGALALQVHPLRTARDGRAFVPLAGGAQPDQAQTALQRGMLVGVDAGEGESARLFGADMRGACRKIAQAPDGPAAVALPRAYALDDLTYGILWALVSLDDALLADDHELADRQLEFRPYERLPRSAVGLKEAAGLTAASRMWLGSSFCAGHILRCLASPPGLPAFWTREQSGEEACAWLLFRHKHGYLRRIASQFSGIPEGLSRGFCVPETAVAGSPRWERILLFLSAALMESLGIRVRVCAEPDYADVEGFVLVPGYHAIIATWVRADDLWHVGVVTGGPALREYGEVAGHAAAHAVNSAAAPGRRLAALADYLGLDWTWLRRRCADLARHGFAGLAQPRSRLLSLDGVDAALRYAGSLGPGAAAP